jgi:hypothetical protein
LWSEKDQEEGSKEKEEITVLGRIRIMFFPYPPFSTSCHLFREAKKMKESLGPIEALKLALSKEIEAIEMYRKMAVEHKVAQEIFDFLATEEFKHKNLLEKKIYELSRP